MRGPTLRQRRFGLIVALAVAAVGLGAGIAVSVVPQQPTTSNPTLAAVPSPSGSGSAQPAPATTATAVTPEPVATRVPATVVAAARKARAKVRPSQRASTATGSAAVTAAAGPASSGRIQFGHTYRGHATFYAATGAGNCSFPATDDLMVGAMNQLDYENSRACGAYLAVTGPSGKTITIKVVDRCPECPAGAIDLSRQAFTELAPASAGQIQISWRLLSPALSSPVSYVYKTGSSQYWCAVQVRNHRNPVATLELRTGSSWKRLARQDYDYFVSADGTGCGASIRITDIYGNRLIDPGVAIRPGAVQQGSRQFPAR